MYDYGLTFWDWVFRCACLLHGVRTSTARKCWQDLITLPFWILQIVAVGFVLPFYVFKIVSGRLGPFSLCDVIILGFYVFTTLVMIATALSIRLRRQTLEPLLRVNGRRFGNVAPPLVCTLIELTGFVYFFPERPNASDMIVTLFNVVLRLTKMTFFLIYMDLSMSLTNGQTYILRTLQTSRPKLGALAAKEWELRDRVQIINSALRQILLTTYLESFLIVITLLGHLISQVISPPKLILTLIFLLDNVLLLLALAQECSSFYGVCVETDQLMLRDLRRAKMCRSCHSDISAILRFHEGWDTLKLGCFTHSVENFMKFLGTSLTCVAIALQFDFRVIRSLNVLSNRAA